MLPSSFTFRLHLIFKKTSLTTRNVSSIPLRKLAQPFVQEYHPDRLQQHNATVRSVNLLAIQTVNSLTDAIDAIVTNSRNPITMLPRTHTFESKYTVEFLVVNEKTDTMTRRIVDLCFTDDQQDFLLIQEKNIQLYAIRLKQKAEFEIRKLLHVAGLEVPPLYNLSEHSLDNYTKSTREGHLTGDQLYEYNKQKFHQHFNWNEFQSVYEKVMNEAKEDMQTMGYYTTDEQRKRQFVGTIISRVRIRDEAIIDIPRQCVSIRRLSLLLMDHFEKMKIEDMGRIWETMQIVLVSPSSDTTPIKCSSNSNVKLKESGYTFSFQKGYQLLVDIPIDFLDQDFIREMTTHLDHFYDILVDASSVENFLPSSFHDFVKRRNCRLD